VDGFRLDRGFQLLNPAYPDARSQLDLAGLGLQRFGRGVAVRRDSDLVVLEASVGGIGGLVRGPYADFRAWAALARWAAPALGPVPRLLSAPDASLADSFDAAGFHGPLRTEVLEQFLAGVLAESDGSTSARFVRLLVRSFSLGTPGLPTQGMAAIPHQLAAHLAVPPELESPASAVEADGDGWTVALPDGEVHAPVVVVATDPVTAGRLTPAPVPAMKGLVTWWFSAPSAPVTHKLLVLDGRHGTGPVVNTAVISNAAPSYAPAGRHLVQATALLGGEAPAEQAGLALRLPDRRLGTAGHPCDPPRAPGDAAATGGASRDPLRTRPVRLRRPPRHRVHPGRPRLRPPHGRGDPGLNWGRFPIRSNLHNM